MIILLDIDGVMVPATLWKQPEFLNDGFPAFSLKAVSSLQAIVSQTRASVVLTSSHKFKFSLSEWKDIFLKRGLSICSIDRLEDNTNFLTRKEEVLRWVQLNQYKDFIIIDDDKSLNGLPLEIKKRLILTSPMIGLSDEHVGQAIKMTID